MSDTRYNGWTNYETWAVNLWLDNNEGSHDYWVDRAKDVYRNEAKQSAHFTKFEDATVILADIIKEAHQEAMADQLECAALNISLWADLLNASLSVVNWREIAERMLESADISDNVIILS
jgi:hypothetical protein